MIPQLEVLVPKAELVTWKSFASSFEEEASQGAAMDFWMAAGLFGEASQGAAMDS